MLVAILLKPMSGLALVSVLAVCDRPSGIQALALSHGKATSGPHASGQWLRHSNMRTAVLAPTKAGGGAAPGTGLTTTQPSSVVL